MIEVMYFDECKWTETERGLFHEFSHNKQGKLAEVALVDGEQKLWRFETFLPEKFKLEGRNATGVVFSAAAAKKVVEAILLNTVLVRL